MERENLVRDMTLMLAYLTSWKEKTSDGEALRSWKSYDWDAIDRLRGEGLVTATNKAKSLYLTEEGAKQAEMLVDAYRKAVDSFREKAESLTDAVVPVSNAPAFRFRVDLTLIEGRECWREVVVPASATFSDLHEAIQSSFSWWNYHLYDFKLRSHGEQCEISDPDQSGIDMMFAFDDGRHTRLDARALPLSEVFPRTRTAVYSYDYGDGWEHRIKLVESIGCFEGEMPVCTGGAGDAPPEDVGGPWGFEEFLRIIEDEADPECESMRAWGESQFFARFDLEKTNDRMRKWRTGELLAEWDDANKG